MNEVNVSNAAEVARTVKGGAVVGPSTVRRSPSITALAGAMAKAQTELRNPPKDSVNPHFKSRYADLATVRDAVVPVLVRHGLAVMQFPCELDDSPALTTLLTHTSGEWVETTMRLRPAKLDPQGVGSALTYARRYALQAVVGVAADDDDDGHAGSQAGRQATPEARANAALRAKYAQRFAECATRDDYLGVCRGVADDVRAGVLTQADRDALAPVARETAARFPDAKAGGAA